MDDQSSKKIVIGIVVTALCSVLLGGCIGYFLTHTYMKTKVLKDIKKDGYILTSDATATSSDIVEGKTAVVDGQLVSGTMDYFDTSDATASENQILNGKFAYGNGKCIFGDISLYSQTMLTASTYAINIEKGQYLYNDVVIEGDENLISENIKKGVTIFGVEGSYVGSEEQEEGESYE